MLSLSGTWILGLFEQMLPRKMQIIYIYVWITNESTVNTTVTFEALEFERVSFRFRWNLPEAMSTTLLLSHPQFMDVNESKQNILKFIQL